MASSSATRPTAARSGSRAPVGTVALVLTALSVLGLAVLIVGDIAGIEGADENEQGWVGFDVAWVTFALGAILALVTGAIAFVLGRRGAGAATRTAGLVAVGWFVLAVLLVVIVSALKL